ncbi:PAS domain-containing protein [Parahaliea sp. F7430]|uniref:histidine kinase n=1 Tax=Sediminihaliea albiluteola TaxID=2758564 RepID=A0A7W2YJG3_9GAMM|nr:ATP-binding protein [Sediminihaliea albiluteola]MBA6413090.1 PAS domain-containing protein [Sediminihaliea albiluteola]
MSFSLAQIVTAIVAYLSILFLVAHLADRELLPRRITHHPATYVLSLGVFAGAMASNAIFELAWRYGYGFLMYYLGAVLMFLMATMLLLPLLRLCRVYQLSSLADVLTFRFRSQWVGAAISIAMCITLLPLLALQIQAVADSIHILAGASDNLGPSADRQDGLALMFCIIIIVFAILFGTRNIASQKRNTGLVTAIAFESLVKMFAMLGLMFAAIYQVFGSFDAMQSWLANNPTVTETLQQPLHGNTTRLMLLLFFSGAVCMPHIFHMAFAENKESLDLRAASWGLPLFLLVISLPILPISWASNSLTHDIPREFSGLALGLGLKSQAISATAFVAGLSAASATIIVTTLALANMILNHLILPRSFFQIGRENSLYSHLKWLRRSLITLLILAGYGCFLAVNGRQNLAQLGLIAFVGTLQFLPGILATPYWNGGNRRGLLCGLAAGLGIWFFALLLPGLGAQPWQLMSVLAQNWFGNSEEVWAVTCVLALGANTLIFIAVSLLTGASEEERVAAEICSMDDLNRPTRRSLSLQSAVEFIDALASTLGERTARAEVRRALMELQFDEDEARPYALRRLRSRIEANLSGLMGPSVAQTVLDRCIPFQPDLHGSTEDLYLIERQLDQAEGRFTGLAAELDNLRRHYRQTLDNLPIGVFSTAADGEILLWNRSMEMITGIPARLVLGSLQDAMPAPWQAVFSEFLADDNDLLLKREVVLANGNSRWISLQKASTENHNSGDRLMLVEDISDLERLEAELLHSERLASIGRLAAGVAHEIGNPITGIACLAQNLDYSLEADEVRETARDILKQTQRVSRIVESLVNFSHVGSSMGDTRLEPCNLANCIDEAIHLLQLDHKAQPVTYCNDCDRELVVLADSQKLLQVFINLLGNARDACMDEGLIRTSAHCDKGKALISVEDNGCGIPVEIQGQVFEPFYTTKEPGEGTGLGLALVYSIMEDMQGQIQLQSPIYEGPQGGTRFILQLPLATYGEEYQLKV